MRASVALLLLSIPLGVLQAASYDLPAEWLDTHTLTLQTGDTARVTGSSVHPTVNLANLDWQGGMLALKDCRLEADAGRTPSGLPLVVNPGQELFLQQTWIQGVPCAIELAGGGVHLQESTLAATDVNIRSSHPDSHLWLEDVNLCASATGLELDSVDTVLIEGALFLTNGTGLRIGTGSQVVLRDCLFQGNEWAIRIAAGATPPILDAGVDLVDSRYALVENLSPTPIDLANSHVDELGMIQGAWLRTGVDPGAPSKPLQQLEPPIIISGEDIIDLPFDRYCLSLDGYPCKISMANVYESTLPYSNFIMIESLSPGETYSMNINGLLAKYYRITYFIGEWEY